MNRGEAFTHGPSFSNAPPTWQWARELMLRDPNSWTLTIGQDPA